MKPRTFFTYVNPHEGGEYPWGEVQEIRDELSRIALGCKGVGDPQWEKGLVEISQIYPHVRFTLYAMYGDMGSGKNSFTIFLKGKKSVSPSFDFDMEVT